MRASHAWDVWSCHAVLVVDDASDAAPYRPAPLIEDAVAMAHRELAIIDETVSRFRGDSEANRIASQLDAGAVVSPLLAEFVEAGLIAARLTDGLVDPTLGRRLADLGYDRDIRFVLDDGRPVRAVVTDVAGWHRVDLRGRRLRVPADRALDLGASAKAYAADRVAAAIARDLGCSVLLSLGGDIATAGPDPADGWQVLIEDLPGEPRTVVRITAGHAVATSSTLHRRWRRGDAELHHILDPRTGMPAPPTWRTVTVAAESCLLANAYSTAAVVLGDAAPEWLSARAAARLVHCGGGVLTVSGWPTEDSPAPAEGEVLAHG